MLVNLKILLYEIRHYVEFLFTNSFVKKESFIESINWHGWMNSTTDMAWLKNSTQTFYTRITQLSNMMPPRSRWCVNVCWKHKLFTILFRINTCLARVTKFCQFTALYQPQSRKFWQWMKVVDLDEVIQRRSRKFTSTLSGKRK